MKNIAIYDPATGAIVSVKLVQDSMVGANTPPGYAALEVSGAVQPGDWYVNLVTLEAMACQPFALGYPVDNTLVVNEEMVITNVPIGTWFKEGNEDHVVTDGDFEWSCDTPGSYAFYITHPHYISEEYHVEVFA